MAYLPGYEYDYFLSYAVVDDGQMAGVENGWITSLERSLDVQLSQEIGRAGRLEVFWDRRSLTRNEVIESQIRKALQSTACFVLVLTPGFLESPWCPRELDWFREAIARQPRNASRIFVVDQGKVPNAEVRRLFDGNLQYAFFERAAGGQNQLLGYPEPDSKLHPGYYNAVATLARELGQELRRLRELNPASSKPADTSPPAPIPAAVAASNSPGSAALTVFLAETSDELIPQRRQVQHYLEDNQYRVLRVSSPAATLAGWRQQAEPLLQQADAFVQLLGQSPGRDFDDSPDGLVLQQAALAVELSAGRSRQQLQPGQPGSGPLQVLQWRSPDLLPKLRDQPELQDLFRLAEGAGVIAGPLEEFKAEIKRTVKLPPPAPPPRQPLPEDQSQARMPLVFINAGPEDLPQAERLLQLLADLNCLPFTPLLDGSPEEIRRELDAGLLDSDGLIYFYGQISTEWLRRQFRTLPTILPRRTQQQPPRPQPAVAICCGEPPGKPRPGVAFPGMKTIDLLQADAVRQLQEWVELLRQGGAT
ncbi:MAG: toll/interleukin-1 receptor domain-containing protein [Planctomycetaceae bacterium]